MIKYTNLELLHAVLCKHDAVWLSVGALPRKTEGGAAVTDCDGGDCASKHAATSWQKRSRLCISTRRERSAICHYLGIIYTRLIAQKLYGIDCMVPLNLIEQPGRKICKIQRCIPPGSDRIRGKQNAWSVWEPVGRSENSQAAFGNGCRAASEIEKINENPLAKSAACMTYYERLSECRCKRAGADRGRYTLVSRRRIISRHIISRFSELFADEQPGELYGSSGGFELELTLPWTEEGKRGFRHLQIGTDPVTIALMREGKYDQILKRMENVLDLSKECRFCGKMASG